MRESIHKKSGGLRPAHVLQDCTIRAAAHVQALFVRLMVANSGAAASEYAFLIAFIAILAAFGMVLLGDDIKVYFQDLATALDNAAAPTPDPFAS